jgi:hypothetical protein
LKTAPRARRQRLAAVHHVRHVAVPILLYPPGALFVNAFFPST